MPHVIVESVLLSVEFLRGGGERSAVGGLEMVGWDLKGRTKDWLSCPVGMVLEG